MSDAPVAREAADAADVRAIDVADAADASAEALAEALADAPVVQVEDAVGLARLRLLGDEPAPFEADLPEVKDARDARPEVLRLGRAAHAAACELDERRAGRRELVRCRVAAPWPTVRVVRLLCEVVEGLERATRVAQM